MSLIKKIFVKQITQSNPSSKPPSQIENIYWIYANNPHDKSQIDPKLSGKWMLFIDKEKLDKVWEIIKEDTMQGKLGYSSKCSTAKSNPNAINDKEGLICVYTSNINDKEANLRVAKQIRRLIYYPKSLYYKNDMETRTDNYEGFKYSHEYKFNPIYDLVRFYFKI